MSGALRHGEHLYLDEIARRLGVSTNPVREALRRLESEELIINRPHIGAVVAAIDVEKIEVHFMIRGVLEGLAVKLAAAHLTPAELAQLEALDGQLDQLAREEGLSAWNECNVAFYRLLFAGSRSPELVALVDLQRDRSPRYRHFPDVLRQRAQETVESRPALLAALRTGDGDTAERLHRANVTRVGQLLCDAMRRALTRPESVEATFGANVRRVTIR